MAPGVSATTTMAFVLLFSLVVVVPGKVHAAVQEAEEGLLRLPSSVAEPDPDRSLVEPEPVEEPDPDRSSPVKSVAEPDPDRSSPVKSVSEPDPDRSSPLESVAEPDPDRSSPVESVAEPDPDRSHPDSDELATTKKPCSEGRQQGSEKVKEQIDDDQGMEKANRKHKEGKKKTKKHHDGDGEAKKEKQAKKHHRQSDDDEDKEEFTKKRIHRHHRAEESMGRKNKLSLHIKNKLDNSDDSDDEEEEKMGKRWRKAIKKRFGHHGRRYQREEADKEKVNI